MTAYKILIVDDHEVVIKGVRSLLSDNKEFEVVGQATNGLEAVEMAGSLSPDVAIMDISMPEMDGVAATKLINQIAPQVKVVVYSSYADEEYVLELFKAGVSAYVLKGGPASDLLQALTAVKSGGTYYTSEASAKVARQLHRLTEDGQKQSILDKLSRREREVFQLLADGVPVAAIAEKLYISPKTVETHKYNIMDKLKIRSMPELTKLAIRHKLVKP